jgi:glycerol uptake operon antiterminator
MPTMPGGSLLTLPPAQVLVPAVETPMQFAHELAAPQVHAVVVQHCNLFECAPQFATARRRGCAVYVNLDRIEGIQADSAGVRYLAEQLHVTGVISIHAKALASAKQFGLETVQRIMAVDSTGLDVTLQSVDVAVVDLLDFLPALVVPHIIPELRALLPLPFMASGLVFTTDQVRAIVASGARAVVVAHPERFQAA